MSLPLYPRRIQTLPLLLANQIAAGEVVERPASVVKELLENALDAGATEITIELEKAGIGCIRIRDNGHGIHKEDLPLAISRHATSKILSVEDLQAISSLGFRGEALASIAAVARLSIKSKIEAEELAWCLLSDPLEAQAQISPTAHPKGTTIEIRDLFFSVPARRKFLRSDRTELLQIEAVVKQIALSYTHVQFTLKHEKNTLFMIKAAHHPNEARLRIGTVCGKLFLDHSLPIDVNDSTYHLHGWIGTAGAARTQSDHQYFYVNGRIVRDKLINHALKMAYQAHVPEGRYPVYALYFTLPVDQVDVNVHPTKHELRFYESRHVHDFLAFHLAQAWSGSSAGVAKSDTETQAEHAPVIRQQDSSPVVNRVKEPSTAHYLNTLSATLNKLPERLRVDEAFLQHAKPQTHSQKTVEPASVPDEKAHKHALSSRDDLLLSEAITSSCDQHKTDVPRPLPLYTHELLHIISPHCLIIKIDQGLVVMSLEKMLKTVAYENLITINKEIPFNGETVETAQSFSLTAKQVNTLSPLDEALEQYGIVLSALSADQWLIRKKPMLLNGFNLVPAIQHCLEQKIPLYSRQFCEQFIKHLVFEPETFPTDRIDLNPVIHVLLSEYKGLSHTMKPCHLIRWDAL